MIQYIVAAGVGALLGKMRRTKSFAKGGMTPQQAEMGFQKRMNALYQFLDRADLEMSRGGDWGAASWVLGEAKTEAFLMRKYATFMGRGDAITRLKADIEALQENLDQLYRDVAFEITSRRYNTEGPLVGISAAQRRLANIQEQFSETIGEGIRNSFERGGLLDEEDVKDWLYDMGVDYEDLMENAGMDLNDIQDQYIGLVFDPVRALWARSQGDLDAMDEYAKGGRTKKFEPGDMYSKNFNYNGMLRYAESIDPKKTSLDEMRKFAESAEDVNYHDLATPIYRILDIKEDPEAYKRSMIVELRQGINNYYEQMGVKKRVDLIGNFAKGGRTRKFQPGQMYSKNFNYKGMLKYAEGVNSKTPRDEMEKFAESAEDVNYHRLANPTFNYLRVDTDPDYLVKRYIFELRSAVNRYYQQQGKKKRIDVYKHFERGGEVDLSDKTRANYAPKNIKTDLFIARENLQDEERAKERGRMDVAEAYRENAAEAVKDALEVVPYLQSAPAEEDLEQLLSVIESGGDAMTEVQRVIDTYQNVSNPFRYSSGYRKEVFPYYAKGGKTQGYNDKLDESLGSREGAGSTKEQDRRDRRDESEAMEKSMGRRKYAAVDTMDIEDRMMEKGGKVSKFDKLANAVAAQYRKKGFSDEKAQEIGDGTAAKVYREQQAKKS